MRKMIQSSVNPHSSDNKSQRITFVGETLERKLKVLDPFFAYVDQMSEEITKF